MIQDLNGNHVIQKCLNRLSSQDSQFIFDAVAQNCVAVGTHRHGCCVIQRCIDHASGMQKVHLIEAITRCAFPLVQDPFGNYVLQYIFDLGEEEFSQPLCRAFLGAIAVLSKQKFSSNVIEKVSRSRSWTKVSQADALPLVYPYCRQRHQGFDDLRNCRLSRVRKACRRSLCQLRCSDYCKSIQGFIVGGPSLTNLCISGNMPTMSTKRSSPRRSVRSFLA